MTSDAKTALAKNLAQTTVMSFSEALAMIDMSVEAYVDGRRLVQDANVEVVIRTYSQAYLTGVIRTSFGDFLAMLELDQGEVLVYSGREDVRPVNP